MGKTTIQYKDWIAYVEFSRFYFDVILHMLTPPEPVLIVPLVDGNLHPDTSYFKTYFSSVPLVDVAGEISSWTDETIKNLSSYSIVTEINPYIFYSLEAILWKENPLSLNFNNQTVKTYYKTKYNIDITNIDQPLLLAKSNSKLVPSLCRVSKADFNWIAKEKETGSLLMHAVNYMVRVKKGFEKFLQQKIPILGSEDLNLEVIKSYISHSSFNSVTESNTKDYKNYELLEKVGDSVLELCLCSILFLQFTNLNGRDLHISHLDEYKRNDYLRQSKEIYPLRCYLYEGKNDPSDFSDLYEAFLAVVYIHQGYQSSIEFVSKSLEKDIGKFDFEKKKSFYSLNLHPIYPPFTLLELLEKYYHFNNPNFLYSSVGTERSRYEFLGIGVRKFIIVTTFYEKYPKSSVYHLHCINEGCFNRKGILQIVGNIIGLNQFFNDDFISFVYTAIVGAIFLDSVEFKKEKGDQSFKSVRKFISDTLLKKNEEIPFCYIGEPNEFQNLINYSKGLHSDGERICPIDCECTRHPHGFFPQIPSYYNEKSDNAAFTERSECTELVEVEADNFEEMFLKNFDMGDMKCNLSMLMGEETVMQRRRKKKKEYRKEDVGVFKNNVENAANRNVNHYTNEDEELEMEFTKNFKDSFDDFVKENNIVIKREEELEHIYRNDRAARRMKRKKEITATKIRKEKKKENKYKICNTMVLDIDEDEDEEDLMNEIDEDTIPVNLIDSDEGEENEEDGYFSDNFPEDIIDETEYEVLHVVDIRKEYKIMGKTEDFDVFYTKYTSFSQNLLYLTLEYEWTHDTKRMYLFLLENHLILIKDNILYINKLFSYGMKSIEYKHENNKLIIKGTKLTPFLWISPFYCFSYGIWNEFTVNPNNCGLGYHNLIKLNSMNTPNSFSYKQNSYNVIINLYLPLTTLFSDYSIDVRLDQMRITLNSDEILCGYFFKEVYTNYNKKTQYFYTYKEKYLKWTIPKKEIMKHWDFVFRDKFIGHFIDINPLVSMVYITEDGTIIDYNIHLDISDDYITSLNANFSIKYSTVTRLQTDFVPNGYNLIVYHSTKELRRNEFMFKNFKCQFNGPLVLLIKNIKTNTFFPLNNRDFDIFKNEEQYEIEFLSSGFTLSFIYLTKNTLNFLIIFNKLSLLVALLQLH